MKHTFLIRDSSPAPSEGGEEWLSDSSSAQKHALLALNCMNKQIESARIGGKTAPPLKLWVISSNFNNRRFTWRHICRKQSNCRARLPDIKITPPLSCSREVCPESGNHFRHRHTTAWSQKNRNPSSIADLPLRVTWRLTLRSSRDGLRYLSHCDCLPGGPEIPRSKASRRIRSPAGSTWSDTVYPSLRHKLPTFVTA